MREAHSKREMIEVICCGCNRFIAYIPVESDLWCPRCSLWAYKGLGGDKGKQSTKAAKG